MYEFVGVCIRVLRVRLRVQASMCTENCIYEVHISGNAHPYKFACHITVCSYNY